jgi:predicted DNA-binding transcriptional regulator AlpA
VDTALLIFAQFKTATLSMTQVRSLLGNKAEQTIRNKVSRGEFPRPTKDGVWRVQDVADYIDGSLEAA